MFRSCQSQRVRKMSCNDGDEFFEEKKRGDINKPQLSLHPDLFILQWHLSASMSFLLLYLLSFSGHYLTPVCLWHTREVPFLITLLVLLPLHWLLREFGPCRSTCLIMQHLQLHDGVFLTGLRNWSVWVSMLQRKHVFIWFYFHNFPYTRPLLPPTPFSVVVFLRHWTLI